MQSGYHSFFFSICLRTDNTVLKLGIFHVIYFLGTHPTQTATILICIFVWEWDELNRGVANKGIFSCSVCSWITPNSKYPHGQGPRQRQYPSHLWSNPYIVLVFGARQGVHTDYGITWNERQLNCTTEEIFFCFSVLSLPVTRARIGPFSVSEPHSSLAQACTHGLLLPGSS